MNFQKNNMKILIALGAAFVMSSATYVLFTKIQDDLNKQKQIAQAAIQSQADQNSLYQYYVLTRDIPTLGVVSDADIKSYNFDSIIPDAISDKSKFLGLVVTRNVRSGEIVSNSFFEANADAIISPSKGNKAVCVDTSKFEGKTPTMKAMMYYDVYSMTSDFSIGNIKALSCLTDNGISYDTSLNKSKSIIFEVPNSKVKDFIEATKGNFYLVLREKGDNSAFIPAKSVKKAETNHNLSNYSNVNINNLPKLPPVAPLGGVGISPISSTLPPPISFGNLPSAHTKSVELIEANVKSTLNF